MTLPNLNLFKDRLGRWRSKSLFIEHAHPDYPALFTLSEEDRVVGETTYISCKRKYLEYKDPTEHTFAQAVFGSYQCWKTVSASPDIAPYVEEWRAELDLHLRAEAFKRLRERAEAGDVPAAKAIAFGTHPTPDAPKNHRTAGRPRKAGSVPTPAQPASHEDAFKRLFPTPTTLPTSPSPPFTVTSYDG